MREATNRDFNGQLLTYKQAAEKSNLGLSKVIELTKESGALVKIGRIARVDWNVFYNYIITKYTETSSEEESETVSGKVGVNVGKTARKIAAAKTTSQLRAVIAEIKGDMQEVKAGIEKGWCDESEMEKVNSLMAQAQNRMGQVENREATPEEENMFAMASLM